MSKTLIIAEKPSVAADVARALGGFTRHDNYFESAAYVLSSAVGHLLEIGMPEEEEVKRGKWTFGHLPAIPSHFALKPIEKNEDRLKLLLRLIKRKDVGDLINACDAGREGELIFRYIVQFAKATKPIRRLWLQSMTTAAIREGFERLRTDAQMRPLADAAVCRSEADWLVGINGTRAMTAFNSKSGGFQLTTVGRVQTPTLAIMVEREQKIRAFRRACLLGSARHLSRPRGRVRGPLVRREVDQDRGRPRRPRRAAMGRGEGPRDRREMRRQAGDGDRGGEADDAGRPAALRPHLAAARSQRPLRALRPHDAVARAIALREAQGAHLPANRFARAAGGLHRHREGDDGSAHRARTRTARSRPRC